MNPDDFKNPSAGKVIRHSTGYYAFIPAALPLALAFDSDLVLMLSRADASLSELSGLGRVLPNPHLLISPLIRREAVQSSRIEGTQASLSDILLDEATPAQSAQGNADDLREVRNYVTALEHGIGRLESLPLSLRLVRELHGKLMTGVRGDKATPGEFRTSQNWIGPAGSNLMNAAYVPPPVDEMKEVLADWERYLHTRDQAPDLIQCAIMHEQFEAIHPFLDGNGRVGRLMITLFLIERGRLSRPLLYLSDFIERHRQDYYDLLQRVRTHGEWLPWIRYFLTGVEETARDAATRARRLLELREAMLKQAEPALVDQLLVNPYISIGKAATVMGVTHPTATKILRKLEAGGLLREVTRRTWGKIYLATGVLAALEPPAKTG
ncbi:MAG: Fic family protein [Opitutaceae bacterium]|jgi:Fic family protein|nr:Fic family protein [Opitutaceae bacterium]